MKLQKITLVLLLTVNIGNIAPANQSYIEKLRNNVRSFLFGVSSDKTTEPVTVDAAQQAVFLLANNFYSRHKEGDLHFHYYAKEAKKTQNLLAMLPTETREEIIDLVVRKPQNHYKDIIFCNEKERKMFIDLLNGTPFQESYNPTDKNEQLYWKEKELEWQKEWQLFRLKAGFSFGVGCLLVAGILRYAYKKYFAYQEKKKQAQMDLK